MINVTEEISLLTKQENQLHTSLDDLRGQRSKAKEYKQVEKDLATVLRKSQNLQAWAVFEVGMPVYRLDSNQLGIVKGKNTTPGGMREIWVSWDGTIEIPEQPNLLQIDGAALAKIIAVGDRIEIRDGHEEAGKIFTVGRLLACGAVETTDEMVFDREHWQKVEVVTTVTNDNYELISNVNATSIVKPKIQMSKELLKESEPLSVLTVQDIGELTEDEEQERHRLELKVERAFCEAGWALDELRDKKLYRSTHKSFEIYCRERFNYTRDTVYLKIAAATVYRNIENNLPTIGRQIPLPTNERQLRDLAKADLTPSEQFSVWVQAVDIRGGKVPTGSTVKSIVQHLKDKPLIKASDFCSVGDPFILTRLEGAERKYNGCWAIANDLREFTIAVDVHNTTLAVKPDNLDPIDLPDVRRQLPETLKRIKQLRDCGLLDRCAYTVLESLGRQIYLTDVEEGLLHWLEDHYGVKS
jgi:hypothetical protein